MSSAFSSAVVASSDEGAPRKRCFREIVEQSKDTGPRLRHVLVANLAQPRHASSAMKALTVELPLDLFSLNHCKRIRKNKATGVLQLLLGTYGSRSCLTVMPMRHQYAPMAMATAAGPVKGREEVRTIPD